MTGEKKFKFEVQTAVTELLQDLLKVEAMVDHVPGVYQDVVDVDYVKVVQVLPEHLVHKALECGGRVGQPVQHDPVLIVP